MSIDKINNTKLSEEEKKAINYLTKYINWETFGERNLSADIETVLNLIIRLKKENKVLKHDNKILVDEEKNYIHTEQVYNNQIQQYKKQIDLMAEEINLLHESLIEEYGDYKTQFSENGKKVLQENIKQYFEKQAKEKGE